MIIKLIVCYDGTNYCGWQIQKNQISVQQVLEKAIKQITGETVKVAGSGRTDAGVHAEGQVCSFETNCNIPPENFAKALNTVLPADVKAVKSQKATENFNARKSAKKKTYVYSLYLSQTQNPLKERYASRIDCDLDLEKMIKASKLLLGKHDFVAFSSVGSSVKTTVREIYDLSIDKTGEDIKISVTGNGFLYNMVRIIVGTLVKAGKGDIEEKEIEKMLNGGNRALGGATMPAKGLCLKEVCY